MLLWLILLVAFVLILSKDYSVEGYHNFYSRWPRRGYSWYYPHYSYNNYYFPKRPRLRRGPWWRRFIW